MRPKGGFLNRLGAAFAVMFGGDGGGMYGAAGSSSHLILPSSGFDYDTASRDTWRNSAVFSGIQFIQTTFVDPNLQVTYRRRNGVEDPIPNHPLARLVNRPNEFYSGQTLWKATLISWIANGNAYWLKVRGAGGAGEVKELWYVPHYRMWPWFPPDGSEFISGYVYYVGGRRYVVPRSEVVHFRNGLDPYNDRLGLSPLHAVLREIFTDNEAATYTAALLRNCGVPGVVVSPKDPLQTFEKEDRDALAASWQAKYTNEHAGSALFASQPLSVEPVGFSPEQLALDKIREVPEERIAGALQIPAAVIALGAGTQLSTYSNMQEFRRAAFDSCIIPTQTAIADILQHGLLPDLGDPDRETVGWDYRNVRYLQENETDRVKRATLGYRGGVLLRSEARTITGHDSKPEDDVYCPMGPAAGTGPGQDDPTDSNKSVDREPVRATGSLSFEEDRLRAERREATRRSGLEGS